ncbi:DUF6238 family protein [Streptomyces calidiresistens]|uniref:Uncharacterized protein n=1 Tax=Streptomyces calidiresistens TaxID=1485586 RepID=A0A7W3T7H4_9ACTN|nr:DUF6238 family protein [Streptomyces calidiresistens]MBB0232382.1 hypothetical protein [Streptomyces calidiresistens]
MPYPSPSNDAHPYLRAASAGVRHHTRSLAERTARPREAVDRVHLDVLHAHLTALHRLLDHLTESARPPYPAAGRQLAIARTRLWQTAGALHEAFHLLPAPHRNTDEEECHPDLLPEGPPLMTICRRHLASGHAVRRRTTPTDLKGPPHGHTTHCVT